MTDEPGERYRFERCELRPDRREFLRDGVVQPVEPQVFDLLLLLLRAAGRLVSHDELVAAIWNGRIVSDSAISARISAARTAIGDDGSGQRLIRTVPRRGFRFVGEVVTGTDAAPPAPAEQHVRFCHSRDGTSIAYATTGDGPALVKVGHWLTHLEHDFASPIWRPVPRRGSGGASR